MRKSINTPADHHLMTVKEVAADLRIGVATVWRGVKSGDLPQPIKIGGLTFWRRSDIEALYAPSKGGEE